MQSMTGKRTNADNEQGSKRQEREVYVLDGIEKNARTSKNLAKTKRGSAYRRRSCETSGHIQSDLLQKIERSVLIKSA